MLFTIVESKANVPKTAYEFLAPGGTIGRSVDNHLILPDESRIISRLQAVVHIAASGACQLTNHGSVTPVVHNGVTMSRGARILIQHGDVLDVGGFHIAVSDPDSEQHARENIMDPLALFQPVINDPLEAPDKKKYIENHPVDIKRKNHQQPQARAARKTDARLGVDPVGRTAPPAESGSVNEHHLLTALFEGMGLDSTAMLTEDQMRMMGRMLSLFSQGTVALLSSRSILKRGVKAEMTMILNEANNPFKILPSGKTVLMQIFQSQMPGFMPAEQAVRDAMVDLQAHQLGMIAGIRAIIAAMLQSFNPQRLEDAAQRDGAVSHFAFHPRKKSTLWNYFVRHYQRIAGEIEDDFHTLFGEAFLKAYDMEVNQYKDSQIRPEEK